MATHDPQSDAAELRPQLTEEQHAALRREADRMALPLSEYLRRLVRDQSTRLLSQEEMRREPSSTQHRPS